MCHVVVLLMPLVALPVFWMLPLPQAAAVYGVVLVLSLVLYRKLYKAMCQQIVTGKEALVGAVGRVLEAKQPRQSKVIVRSEIWNAESTHRLSTGEPVVVLGMRGLRLVVEPARTAATSNTEIESHKAPCHG